MLVPIVIANFIASNVVCRLPHGAHSFVHQSLARDETWLKLQERDFIETDAQEDEVNLALFESTIRLLFMTDSDRARLAFDAWRQYRVMAKCQGDQAALDPPAVGVASRLSPSAAAKVACRLSPKNQGNAAGLDSQRDLEEGLEKSPFKQDSSWSFLSGGDEGRGEDASQVRQQRRELWETLIRVIPGFDLNLWKTLDQSQRLSIGQLASDSAGIQEAEAQAGVVTPSTIQV